MRALSHLPLLPDQPRAKSAGAKPFTFFIRSDKHPPIHFLQLQNDRRILKKPDFEIWALRAGQLEISGPTLAAFSGAINGGGLGATLSGFGVVLGVILEMILGGGLGDDLSGVFGSE